MKPQTHIWPEEFIEAEGFVTASATIESSDRQKLWYRVPIEYRSALSSTCDPFVVATILTVMRSGDDCVVHGEVSPSLLSNLEEFQAAWSSWRPDTYRIVPLSAESEREAELASEGNRAISAFSGGVDSCFTALRHRTGGCGRQQRNLEAGLMVRGFDIPLEDGDEIFERAAERSRTMLSSVGMELVPMATNFREAIAIPWEDAFGIAIASCLHLLQRKYTAGLIPSSYGYRALSFPYGSNPVSDPLLSSRSLEIVHDGAIAIRLEKIQALVNWPEAIENLRVCWQGEQKDRNCGRCEKCVRNILNFRAIGAGLPSCFERDVTDDQILKLRVRGGGLDALEGLLAAIPTERATEPWVKALKRTIRRNRAINALEARIPKPWKNRLRQIKKIGG
ncbi:hypothetical protein [Oscillatoria sp. FACHB-1406]|uniref:hypothetical protein n=1 Tax=Oscillatoria sp. FACHB-1406 TaxID=2692846 RepID=UPI001687DF44|nr:hypothetical protein [Oscillatoria sp. FACHB-1406]MBD2579634.1 hypothetical protein [Oscillatoria sp. FACHB-1406]